MIRIRPGRSWRLNPAYVGELRSLSGARAKGFTGADILDVLGIEVFGVDIAAGVGEARVLQAVDELAQALIRIGDGRPAAQATIGPGPTELVLEARGQDLLLTLVTLAPPARVLASGLLVDAQKMRSATLHAARGLLLDLLAISPALSDARLARRLGAECAQLARRAQRRAPQWPSRESGPLSLVSHVQRRPEKLSIQLPPESMSRLRGAAEVSIAPLAAHLGRGSVTLLRTGAPGLTCEGPVFLFLRNLVADAERLVEAWESGEPGFTIPFGTHQLAWDLTSDAVRAQGWKRPLRLPPLRFARLAAGAAELYAGETLRHFADELGADLRDRALALVRHCADLETGDLRRAPAAVAAPPPRESRERRAPLAQGRMRRLVFRESWRRTAEGAVRALPLPQGRLALETGEHLLGLDAATGKELWRVPASAPALDRGSDLFYADRGDAVVRLDAISGEVRWKRRLRGAAHPARLWGLPAGVLRSLPGEGLAVISDSGALRFRKKLPGGAPREVALASGVIVASLSSGVLAGLDLADGTVLWKRRMRAGSVISCGERVLALSRRALACLDPATGEPSWEREVEGGREPIVHDGIAALIAGGKCLSWSIAKGEPRPPLEAAGATQLLGEDEGPLIAAGPSGSAMRLDGRKRWSIGPHAGASGPALLRRGVLLLHREGTELFDAAEGLALARLPEARAAALGPDLCCALLQGGDLSLHRLATHLSVL